MPVKSVSKSLVSIEDGLTFVKDEVNNSTSFQDGLDIIEDELINSASIKDELEMSKMSWTIRRR